MEETLANNERPVDLGEAQVRRKKFFLFRGLPVPKNERAEEKVSRKDEGEGRRRDQKKDVYEDLLSALKTAIEEEDKRLLRKLQAEEEEERRRREEEAERGEDKVSLSSRQNDSSPSTLIIDTDLGLYVLLNSRSETERTEERRGSIPKEPGTVYTPTHQSVFSRIHARLSVQPPPQENTTEWIDLRAWTQVYREGDSLREI